MGGNGVKANRNILAKGWWHDDMLREDVHRRIQSMGRQGTMMTEIARHVGCSERSVQRILKG